MSRVFVFFNGLHVRHKKQKPPVNLTNTSILEGLCPRNDLITGTQWDNLEDSTWLYVLEWFMYSTK